MIEGKSYKTKEIGAEQEAKKEIPEALQEYFFPSEGISVLARNTQEATEKMLEIKNKNNN